MILIYCNTPIVNRTLVRQDTYIIVDVRKNVFRSCCSSDVRFGSERLSNGYHTSDGLILSAQIRFQRVRFHRLRNNILFIHQNIIIPMCRKSHENRTSGGGLRIHNWRGLRIIVFAMLQSARYSHVCLNRSFITSRTYYLAHIIYYYYFFIIIIAVNVTTFPSPPPP